jgi:DNA-binding SARP family transcriptional activator/tetratricopeptide (TPR) repeat protein
MRALWMKSDQTVTTSAPQSTSLRFTVLGPVRAWRDGTELELGPPQQRAALAVLLIRAGRSIDLSELVTVLWGEDPPATATNVLHRYVGRLRRLFEPELPVRTTGRWLLRDAGGYALAVDEDAVDLLRFRRLARQARAAREQRRPADAVALLIEALELWQAPRTTGIDPQVQDHPLFVALERERLRAVAELVDTALEAGAAERVLATIREAAAQNPWDESLQSRLILALAASGRQAEALSRYDAVRVELAQELGIDPGAELRAAHEMVLRQDLPAEEPQITPLVRPAQLPADLPTFTGRSSELDRVFALLRDEAGPAPTVIISAIDGMAGIGKTTLAVHWAHLVADRFPDGQLYVNLRGFDPTEAPLPSADVIREFLGALGISSRQLPEGMTAQVALYRSLVAGRRMLFLLDNARDVEQVRPLLPGSAGALVIITSRNRMAGLVTRDGAHPLTLELLDVAQSRATLAARLGNARVDDEPAAVEQIIAACGRLPLTLAIAAARAAVNPHFPLAALAGELHDAAGSLDAFSNAEAGTDARLVFSWSYRALSPEGARLFRLLSLYPGPDIGSAAAAALAGAPLRQVKQWLAELSRTHLLNERVPGRFSFHDLLSTYAGELLEEEESAAGREGAERRILDHYLQTGYAANRLIEPHRDPIRPLEPESDVAIVATTRLPDAEAAQTWFDAEYSVLLMAVRHAADQGYETHAWQLTWTMQQYFDRSGHWHDWIATQHIALDAAQRRSDVVAIAHLHRGIGKVYSRLGRAAEAYRELDHSLRLFTELGDRSAQAHLHLVLGAVKSRDPGRLVEALEHSEEALRLYIAIDSRVGRARALNNVGYSHALLGDHASALEYVEASLKLHEDLGDVHGQAAAWDSIALAQHQLGRYPEAVHSYHRALDMFTKLGNRYFAATSQVQLGNAHRDNKQFDLAQLAWQQALQVLGDLDHADAVRVRAKLNELQFRDEPRVDLPPSGGQIRA